MEPGFWHEKWQQQQIGFHQQDVNPFLVTYWHQLALPADAKVFVPLCGKYFGYVFFSRAGASSDWL